MNVSKWALHLLQQLKFPSFQNAYNRGGYPKTFGEFLEVLEHKHPNLDYHDTQIWTVDLLRFVQSYMTFFQPLHASSRIQRKHAVQHDQDSLCQSSFLHVCPNPSDLNQVTNINLILKLFKNF